MDALYAIFDEYVADLAARSPAADPSATKTRAAVANIVSLLEAAQRTGAYSKQASSSSESSAAGSMARRVAQVVVGAAAVAGVYALSYLQQ